MNEETLTRAVNKCQEISIKNVDWSARLLSHVSVPHDTRDEVVDYVNYWTDRAELPLETSDAYPGVSATRLAWLGH
jgi:hypothetical protein